jgi:HrpA-like RNA helicase
VEEYQKGRIQPIDKINVVITQPRRMAAVSMASRVSFERGTVLGDTVGYTIRFDDKTTSNTKLRYITDGIFVRQCVADPYLFKYHVVILDEAH